MSDRKIQQKYKIQTAKVRKSVSLIRRKTPQDVTARPWRRKMPSCSIEYWVGYSNEQSTPSMDNNAATMDIVLWLYRPSGPW